MARSLLQRRLENDRERIAALNAALKNTHHKPKSCDYHEIALALETASDHKPHLIRAAADWKPQLKTRDESRVTLAAARHLFVRFPAPAHLERIWLDTAGLDREEIAFRKACWFAVVSGASLYRLVTSPFLSRRETYAFLTAPHGLTNTKEPPSTTPTTSVVGATCLRSKAPPPQASEMKVEPTAWLGVMPHTREVWISMV